MSVYERDLTSSFAKHAYAKRRIEELDILIKRYFEDSSHQPMMRADLDLPSGTMFCESSLFPTSVRSLSTLV